MILSNVVRSILTDAQAAIVNGGRLTIYSATNVALCSIQLRNPAYHPSIDGVATLNVLGGLSGNPVANGLAHHYSLYRIDDEYCWSGVCGLTGSGKAMELVSMDIFTGIPVAISSGYLTTPVGVLDPTLPG